MPKQFTKRDLIVGEDALEDARNIAGELGVSVSAVVQASLEDFIRGYHTPLLHSGAVRLIKETQQDMQCWRRS